MIDEFSFPFRENPDDLGLYFKPLFTAAVLPKALMTKRLVASSRRLNFAIWSAASPER